MSFPEGARPSLAKMLATCFSTTLGEMVNALAMAVLERPWATSESTSRSRGLVPHRAGYDVLVTARVFVRLATRHDGNPVSLEELRGLEADRKPGGADETASLF